MTQNMNSLTDQKARWNFIERQLRDYRINKRLLESYRDAGSLVAPAVSCLQPLHSGGKPAAPTEKKAVELVELSQQMDKIAWYVAAIDDLLSIASEEERTLLEARYFAPRPQTAWQVANLLYISRTEFYRRRDTLLIWLEKRFGLLVGDMDYFAPLAPPEGPVSSIN